MNIKSQIKEFEEREGLSNIEDIINSISSSHFNHKNPKIEIDQYDFLDDMCNLHIGLKMSQGKDYKIRFHISDLEKYNSLSPSKNKSLRKGCFVSEAEVFNLSVKLKTEKLIQQINTNLKLAKYKDSQKLCHELTDLNNDLKLGIDETIYNLSQYINKSYLKDNIQRMKRYKDKDDLLIFGDLLSESESLIEEISDKTFIKDAQNSLELLNNKYLRILSKPIKIKRTKEYKESLKNLRTLAKEGCFDYYPVHFQKCLFELTKTYSSETLEKDISMILKPYGLEYKEGKVTKDYEKPGFLKRIGSKLKYALVTLHV